MASRDRRRRRRFISSASEIAEPDKARQPHAVHHASSVLYLNGISPSLSTFPSQLPTLTLPPLV